MNKANRVVSVILMKRLFKKHRLSTRLFPHHEIIYGIPETVTSVTCVRIMKGSEDRSSRSQMFSEIDALENFANFTGKHLRWSLF